MDIKLNLILKLFVVLFALLQSELAISQIETLNNTRDEYQLRDGAFLDFQSINEWIDSTITLPTQTSAENWAAIILTTNGNFKEFSACENQYSSRKYKFFDLNLPLESHKALLKYVSAQFELVEQNFSVWFFPTGDERRAAAVSSALECLETIRFNRDEEHKSDVQKCIQRFSWSQPMMTNAKAEKAVQALLGITRTMGLFSCSKMADENIQMDPEMRADYQKIHKFVAQYIRGDFAQLVASKRPLLRWLSLFR